MLLECRWFLTRCISALRGPCRLALPRLNLSRLPLTSLEKSASGLQGDLVLLRLKPFLGTNSKGDWYPFVGVTAGAAPDSKRQSTVLIDVPLLKCQLGVPVHCINTEDELESIIGLV